MRLEPWGCLAGTGMFKARRQLGHDAQRTEAPPAMIADEDNADGQAGDDDGPDHPPGIVCEDRGEQGKAQEPREGYPAERCDPPFGL